MVVMVGGTKRKQKEITSNKGGRQDKDKSKNFSSNNNNKMSPVERKKFINKDRRKKGGPRLPSAMRKEMGLVKHKPGESDEELDSEDGGGNTYDYFEVDDENVAEEDLKKNRRFDTVENMEYDLPEDFEDEDLPSEDEDDEGRIAQKRKMDSSDESGDEGRHVRMLQGITNMPAEYFEGKKKKISDALVSRLKSSPTQGIVDGGGDITVSDLLEPLQGMPGSSKLRKDLKNIDKYSKVVQAPLSKVHQDEVERKIAYEKNNKETTKWEPIVKANREKPTLYFKHHFKESSTISSIVSDHEPRTDFEKSMAILVSNPEIKKAYKEDGARLLELNKISVEDVKDRQNHLARMRSLLFRHELKAKHVKKIKSKTYRRLKNKDRKKTALDEMQMDPEAARENVVKLEIKRATERATLKHKNTTKWAKRILERGLSLQDDDTRVAISNQLQQHSLLTRKMNSVKDDSSSDDTSDEDDDDDDYEDRGSMLLAEAKENTVKAMEEEEEDEIPKSGVLSLPFMVRGLKKKEEEAKREAQLALDEYEFSLKQLEGENEAETPKLGMSSGRRVFGAVTKRTIDINNNAKSDKVTMDSDSEDDFVMRSTESADASELSETVIVDTCLLRKEFGHEPVIENINDTVKNSGPRTTYEVGIFAPESLRKIKRDDTGDENTSKSSGVLQTSVLHKELEEVDEFTDSESVDEMVDGILSSGAKQEYELPSQADLVRTAFAADNVEDEFVKQKHETLNVENPEPEKPLVIPGWGQWTDIQRKRGPPSWMVKEHDDAKKKRAEEVKKRKDAHLNHVIIHEPIAKKSEKFFTNKVPYPYPSKEAFEHSMRVPLAPDFNPVSTVDLNNRPAVVKTPGIIIPPVKYKDIDPYGRGGEDMTKGRQTAKRKTSSKTKGK